MLTKPKAADDFPDAPPSTVFPNHVESILEENSDVSTIGDLLRTDILSPHHFAGTASVGKVIDETFKVIGVEGLYVADASVIPLTTRANSMATAMMVGRRAGVRAVAELGQ